MGFFSAVFGEQVEINKNRPIANKKMAKKIIDKYFNEFNANKYEFNFINYIYPIVSKEIKDFCEWGYNRYDRSSEEWFIMHWIGRVQRLNSGRLTHNEIVNNVCEAIREEIFKYPDPVNVEVTRHDQEWIHFPGKPIEDKNLFLEFISGLIAYTAGDEYFVDLKKLNNEQLFEMFKATLNQYSFKEQTIINKSLMMCYSPTSVVAVPAKDINRFIEDLRILILKK